MSAPNISSNHKFRSNFSNSEIELSINVESINFPTDIYELFDYLLLAQFLFDGIINKWKTSLIYKRALTICGSIYFSHERGTMHISGQVFLLWILFNSLCWIRVFGSFHFKNEDDISANIEENSLISRLNGTKFYKDWPIVLNETSARHRNKRSSDDGTFYGHPKTREEKWHAAFNMSGINLQLEQAQSLVTLLVKVMDKYLNSCIPIVLYDKNVESSEGVILETFFKV